MCCNLLQVGRIAGELADGILTKLWHAAKSEMTQNLWVDGGLPFTRIRTFGQAYRGHREMRPELSAGYE